MVDDLLTEREFAKRFGASLASVRRWRAFAKLPFVRMGKGVWIPLQAAIRWAEERAKRPEKARPLSRPRRERRRA